MTLSLTTSDREAQEEQAGQMDGEVDWELGEQQLPEGPTQQHRV